MTRPRKLDDQAPDDIEVYQPSDIVMSHDLMVVEQLPVITQRLRDISVEVDTSIAEALAMECTDGTRIVVKEMRSQLRKDFEILEGRRKAIKAAILEPYDQFETLYIELIAAKYKTADDTLKTAITKVEKALCDEKQIEVEAYFAEYASSKNIDIVVFSDAGISVNLSTSAKQLKERAKAFIDRVAVDVRCLQESADAAELLAEYPKQGLDLARTIETVRARHKAIEEQKARQAEIEARRTAEQEAVKRVEAAIPAPLAPPAPLELPKVQSLEKDPNELLTPTFRLEPTPRSEVRRLAVLLAENGFRYRIIN